MRIRVGYETEYVYDRPVRSAIQLIRMTPRAHDAQRVGRWRVQVDAPGRLRRGEDAWGNVLHTFYLGGAVERLTIRAEGEAAVSDSAGVLLGAPETFPPETYLRETPLTAHDPAIAALAQSARGEADDALGRLHALTRLINARMLFDADGDTATATTAAQALAGGHGVCQDMAHVFISAARRLGAPARYVSGHLLRSDRTDQEAGHAWAEAHVAGLGWVGFDPANGVSPTDAYLRVATGPDYLAAAPVRGSRSGGGGERMTVRLRVSDAGRATPSQSQSQSQSQG